MKPPFSISVISRVAGAIILLWAPSKHAYGYFQILRWVVCSASCYSAWLAYSSKQKIWTIAFVVLGILFNPLVLFHFSKSLWAAIDVGSAVFFLTSIFFVSEKKK